MIVQGDVFLTRAEIPAGARCRMPGKRGHVLAEGEATGHAHTIEATPDVKLYERNGVLYLAIIGDKPTTVRHEEHKPVTVPPGTYQVGRVREYDPFAEEARQVAD